MMPELTPVWLGDLLAVAMIATSAYCMARIGYARISGCATHRDVDALHVLMGIAMAGMLSRHLTALAPVGGVLHAVWIAVFAVGAGWFALRAAGAHRAARPVRIADSHGSGPVVHLIGAAAMLYMLAATPAGGMAGMGGAAAPSTATLPELGVALAVLATAAAVVILDRLTLVVPGVVRPTVAGIEVTVGAAVPGTTAATRPVIAPRTAECCHLLMCVVTAYMLIAMFA